MNQEIRNALPAGYRLEEYEIESVLGHGGFGVTYLARDTRLDTLVAIKEYMPGDLAVREGGSTVHPRSGADRDEFLWGLERFLSEAQTLARFKHPNIVSVLRFFEGNGTAYLVMEYEEGDSLSDVLRRKKTLKESELWPILIPLLDGLAQVHDVGFLHRDIKPGNIFIRADGSPVLLDFGAARLAIGQKSKSLTAIVTAGYAPQEQYFSGGNQGPWTDIYALAGVLYRAVIGQVPPEAPKRAAALMGGGADPIVPAVTAGKGQCSTKVLAAIDKGLSVLETDRPQSVGDWQTLLFGGREPPAATGATVRRGHGAALGVVVGVLVTVLLFGGGYAAWQMMQDDGTRASQPQAQQALVPSADTSDGTAGDGQASSGDAAISADAIQRAEAAAKARAVEEEAKRQAAEDARKKAEAAAKARAVEEEAKRQAAEDARKKAEAEAKAAAAAKRKAEAAAQKQAEAQRRAEEEARARAAAEAKQQAKADARKKAEEEVRRRTEEEARRKAEAEAAAKRKAEEEAAKRRAEGQARAQAAAEAKRRAEAEARKQAAAEAKRRAEEEARKQAEAEARRRAEEEARARAAADARRKAEEAARKQAAAAAKRQAALDARLAELERRAKEAEERARAAERAAKSSAGSPTQTARIPDPSKPDGLKTLFSGSVVSSTVLGGGTFDGNMIYLLRFAADGLLRGQSTDEQSGAEERDNGRWSVEAGKMCLQWARWDGGEKHCYAIAGKKNPYAASGPPGILKGELFINR